MPRNNHTKIAKYRLLQGESQASIPTPKPSGSGGGGTSVKSFSKSLL